MTAAPSTRLLVATYLGFTLLALSPLFWVTMPALVDYPAHLARVAILAAPGAFRNYIVHWQLIPNLAMDLVVPPLAPLIGVETASRLFVGVTMILPVAATALLHRALFGRVGLWPIFSLLFIYNLALFYGLLNFLFTLGLALLCFAGWVSCTTWRSSARLALFTALATVIFVCHLFAFGVYGLLVGSFELGLLVAARPISARSIGRCVAAAAQFVPAVLIWLANPSAGEPHSTVYGDLHYKILAALAPMHFTVIGWTLAPLLALLAYIAWRRGALRVAPPMRLPLLALMIGAVAMPTTLYGSSMADIRLPIAFSFVIIASTQPQVSRRWLARLITAAAILLLVVKVAAVTLVWRTMDAHYAEFRAVTQDLPRGARLLVAEAQLSDARGHLDGVPDGVASLDRRFFYHISDFAILDRDAIVPNFGLQLAPVEYAARDLPLYGGSHPPLTLAAVVETARGAPPTPLTDYPGEPLYWADWPRNFDYLLVIDFGDRTNPLPDILTPWAQGSFFVYYKIAPAAAN